jgi:hypothetical protein
VKKSFCLPQYPNNLLLAESSTVNVLLFLFEQNSSYITCTFLGFRPGDRSTCYRLILRAREQLPEVVSGNECALTSFNKP